MATSKKFDISNEIALNVSFSGTTGPALIFLHFWGGSSRTFFPVTQLLSSSFRTIAVDFRGWGSSTGPDNTEGYSIQTLANDIEILIAKLELESYFIVGHSMGGKVAQVLAGRGNLAGLKGVVLVAPAPASPLILSADEKAQQISAYTSEEVATFVTNNVLTSSPLPQEIVASLVENMLKGTPAAKEAWPKLGMLENVTDMAKRIDIPVLVVGAELDRVETVVRLTKEVVGVIKDAKMVVIEGKGHLIPVEAPVELANFVRGFVRMVEG